MIPRFTLNTWLVLTRSLVNTGLSAMTRARRRPGGSR